MLQKLKATAEAAQGWKAKFGFSFGHVTISVPVEFGYKQREATKRAGELAGFRQVRLVEEPVAAAMAYGLEYGDKRARYVLVYDLGGGTLDVAVLHLEDGSYRVVGTSGDPHLGGTFYRPAHSGNSSRVNCPPTLKARTLTKVSWSFSLASSQASQTRTRPTMPR